MLSTDSFAYALYGRIFAVYGGDPYVKLEPPYPDDPFLPLTYFLPWPSWYGPLWTLLSGGIALLGREQIGLVVLLFRALAIVCALGTGGLIWAVLRRLAPERAIQGVVCFLWNPLLVLESGLSGHNDALVAVLLLLGVWLATVRRGAWPLVAFTLAAMVKLTCGLVVPFYIVYVLRAAPSWSERAWFLVRAGMAGLVSAGILALAVGHGQRLPVAESATASYFYDNNLYQVIFPRVRAWLGEEWESARVPVHFYPWWSETRRPSVLESAPGGPARDLERIKAGTQLLVVEPLDQGWVRVYNPQSNKQGYLEEAGLHKIERPGWANHEPPVWPFERNSVEGPIAARANSLIRGVTWPLFAAFAAVAAWRVRGERSWLVWTVAAFLALYWLVATEIWPWYVIWSLAIAALVPTSWPARLSVTLSATALTLYATIGFERSAHSWLFTYRSLPAFLLPLVVIVVAWSASRLAEGCPTEDRAPLRAAELEA
jgi:hypothetical protein